MARFYRKAGMLLASALFASHMALAAHLPAPGAIHGTTRANSDSGVEARALLLGDIVADVSWNSVSWNSVGGKP